MIRKVLFMLFFSLTIVSPLYSFQDDAVEPEEESRFLIIHLDGVSSEHFIEMLQGGQLPNIEAYFEDDDIINHAITYFPSKTPNVITSIKKAIPPKDSRVPSWHFRNPDPYSITSMPRSFLQMAFSTSRLSVTNLIYGIQGLHWMAGIALQNSADFLSEYPVVQFYWFPTDTQGHFNGEEAYMKEIRRFDRQFGKLVKRLDSKPVNIIIYSDHGIAFGDGLKPDKEIRNLLNEDLEFFSYPVIYLQEGVNPADYAELLLENTELDFIFYLEEAGLVKGLHADGSIRFRYREGRVRYEFSSSDILGYYESGYNGEFLTIDEWLEMTYESRYTGAPVNIFSYLSNPRSGEMIVMFDEGKFYQTPYSKRGNHGGFSHYEMSVPILLKGPALEDFEVKEHFWLPELFMEIKDLDFEGHPSRDSHAVRRLYNFKSGTALTELELSPTYRISYGITLYHDSHIPSFRNHFNVWGKADLFRSYLSRFWIGAALSVEKERNLPIFLIQYDLNVGKLSLETRILTTQKASFHIGYQVNDWLRVETANFNSAGVRLTF